MSYSLHRSKSLSSVNEFSFHGYRKHSECASYVSGVHQRNHDLEDILKNGENMCFNRSGSEVFSVNMDDSDNDSSGDESDSSGDVYIVNEMNDHSDESCGHNDSGLGGDEVIVALENKIDQLNDLYQEQCRLLADIKDEIRCTKEDPPENGLVMELLLKALQLNSSQLTDEASSLNEGEDDNLRARSLLDALKSKHGVNLDREIAQALVDFLHDEEVQERVVSACVESVRGIVYRTLTRDMSRMYLSVVQGYHRRLLRHHTNVLERAFVQLGRRIASLSFRNCRWLQPALQKMLIPRDLTPQLRKVAQSVLEKELQQWRQKAFGTVMTRLKSEELNESTVVAPRSPPQPAEPGRSIIDQLMMTAEINKQVQDGDINGAFEKALLASDLSLVMAACRAVEPAVVFTPTCRLQPPVLLSLLQQLATDMLHETQLKCRYIEDAVISLNTSPGAATRAHLPLVICDVRKHLTSFVDKYPSHVVSRRLTLIVMACENLLK